MVIKDLAMWSRIIVVTGDPKSPMADSESAMESLKFWESTMGDFRSVPYDHNHSWQIYSIQNLQETYIYNHFSYNTSVLQIR